MNLTTHELQAAAKEAEEFAKDNLKQLCQELHHLESIGIWEDKTKFQRLIGLCEYTGIYAQNVAIALVRSLAIKKIADE